MAVFVDMLGGSSGSTFPPIGTQVREFADSFTRADAGTLGSAWGMSWYFADIPFDAIDRPVPYNTALNPRIQGNQMMWGSYRSAHWGDNLPNTQGFALSVAWPWKLAWMTQAPFDQFIEVNIPLVYAAHLEVDLAVVFSGNPGSMDPDVYRQNNATDPFRGQYGYYSLNIGNSGCSLVYNLFGSNPSATPTGLRGHSGLNFIGLSDAYVYAGVDPSIFRLEARWTGDAWQLTALQNGTVILQATDNHLLQGMPAMACATYPDELIDPDYVARINSFRGGML